ASARSATGCSARSVRSWCSRCFSWSASGGSDVSFRARIKVRFDDEDHARIVYFPRYFHFFHVTFEDFFTQNGYPYRDVLDVDRVGWPAVKAEAEFDRTLRFGDLLDMDLWIERLGT